MAVFPRIVLKNTTDSAVSLNAAIASNGTDPVAVGEIVIRRASGKISLHALDSTGVPVEVGSVQVINDLNDVDTVTSTPVSNNILRWNGTNWVPGSLGLYSIDALNDVDTSTKAPIKGQSLTWDGINWVAGIAATKIGRGDGGDIDITETDSSFVFGVWGGGDFDTTSEDIPIELLRKDIVDGCEIISDFTAVNVNASTIGVATYNPDILIGYTANIDPANDITIAIHDPDQAGVRAFINVDPANIIISAPSVSPEIGDFDYFSNFATQVFGWPRDFYPDWWAD